MATKQKTRTIIGLFLVALLLATWESMSIILKGMQDIYKKPFFISYVCRSTYIICLPLWWIAKTLSGRTLDTLPRWQGQIFIFIISFLSVWGIYAWYKSLALTDIAFNNAIYQTTAIFVYLLSIPFLKMKVTVYGVTALILALGGLALVTCFSPSTTTPSSCLYHNFSDWSTADVSMANVSDHFLKNASACCSYCTNIDSDPTTNCTSWLFNASSGVCLVSHHFVTLNAGNNTCGYIQQSTSVSSILGYGLCLVSVIVYAFYEVLYKLFEHLLEAPGGRAPEAKLVTAKNNKSTAGIPKSCRTVGTEVDNQNQSTLTEFQGRMTDKVGEQADSEMVTDKNQSQSFVTASLIIGHDDEKLFDLKEQGTLDLLTPILACLKFLGLMGMYTIIFVGPFVFVLNATGMENFENPFMDCGGISCFSYMLIDGALDMLYNIGLLVGISLTSPRFMSAGTIMIIPVGVVVEIVQDPSTEWNGWAILGAVIIIMSFLVMEFMEGFVQVIKKCSVDEKGTQRGKQNSYKPLHTSNTI